MNILKRAALTLLPQRIYSYCNVDIVPIVSRKFHLLTSTPNTINQAKGFLEPSSNLLLQVAGFKVKGRLKKRCKDCYFVMRQERLYVICKTHPRHKQMAMKARDYKSWILTHATQSKIRPY